MRAWLLGSAGWMATPTRATTSVLVRRGEQALVLDAGTGISRLVTDPALLDGVKRLDVVLTHFHLDHICGLPYLPALDLPATVWAPGDWLYGRPSRELLAAVTSAPVSPFDAPPFRECRELRQGEQQIGEFALFARPQLRHWAPTAGLRVEDALALITDTAFEPEAAQFAAGVEHLLHEAWSTSQRPVAVEGDSTAAQAGDVAAAANVRRLTLMHLHPLADEPALLADARGSFASAQLGRDGCELQL